MVKWICRKYTKKNPCRQFQFGVLTNKRGYVKIGNIFGHFVSMYFGVLISTRLGDRPTWYGVLYVLTKTCLKKCLFMLLSAQNTWKRMIYSTRLQYSTFTPSVFNVKICIALQQLTFKVCSMCNSSSIYCFIATKKYI